MNQSNAYSFKSLHRNPYALCWAIFFLAFGITGSGASDDRGAASPAEVYSAFETALSSKELRVFMKVCNKPLANFSPGLSCGSLLNEAWHMGRTYTKIAEKSGPAPVKKSVIEVQSTGQDKAVRTLFFLLELTENNHWVLKNINESRQYAETYLK